MIVGGGTIGLGLAKGFGKSVQREKSSNVTVKKAEMLSAKLEKALVLQGDASDQELLFEEHIEKYRLVSCSDE